MEWEAMIGPRDDKNNAKPVKQERRYGHTARHWGEFLKEQDIFLQYEYVITSGSAKCTQIRAVLIK